ncbi:hypothetical protein C8R44DRAFT_383343 [Mycena epipterygia]|nr:hypothetical protein C8R44DRAFT_383343 [Mycena epipterygia]
MAIPARCHPNRTHNPPNIVPAHFASGSPDVERSAATGSIDMLGDAQLSRLLMARARPDHTTMPLCDAPWLTHRHDVHELSTVISVCTAAFFMHSPIHRPSLNLFFSLTSVRRRWDRCGEMSAAPLKHTFPVEAERPFRSWGAFPLSTSRYFTAWRTFSLYRKPDILSRWRLIYLLNSRRPPYGRTSASVSTSPLRSVHGLQAPSVSQWRNFQRFASQLAINPTNFGLFISVAVVSCSV